VRFCFYAVRSLAQATKLALPRAIPGAVGYYIAGMPWNSRLRHPIPLADGRTLRTLADARDMVLSLPARDQRRDKWQTLAAVLLSAAQADSPSLTAIATDRVEEALRRPPFTAVRLANDTQSES
jgi:hypothetical protein